MQHVNTTSVQSQSWPSRPSAVPRTAALKEGGQNSGELKRSRQRCQIGCPCRTSRCPSSYSTRIINCMLAPDGLPRSSRLGFKTGASASDTNAASRGCAAAIPCLFAGPAVVATAASVHRSGTCSVTRGALFCDRNAPRSRPSPSIGLAAHSAKVLPAREPTPQALQT